MLGPDFEEFSTLIGNPNSSQISITSEYEVCLGLEKYEITIAQQLDPDWPTFSISEDGSQIGV